MDTQFLMNRMFPPPRPLSKPVKLSKEGIKNILYLPDIFSPTMKTGSYEDFIAQLKKIYGDISVKNFIKMIKKDSNCINSGRESRVYTIPNIENYVIKESFKPKTKDFKEVKNNFYGHNFGQPVADNHNGLQILLKNKGEPFSVKNWADYYSGEKKLTKEDAEGFLASLKELSSFPQESFDDLAKRISFAYRRLLKSVDCVNPNNYLIDTKNKSINIVDLGDIHECPKSFYVNPKVYMTYPLTDKCLSYDYFQLFTENQSSLYEKYRVLIENKCIAACQKINI